MKNLILKAFNRFKSKAGFKPTKVDVDHIIRDNMELIKQIRLNRMRFYKFYKKSQSSL